MVFSRLSSCSLSPVCSLSLLSSCLFFLFFYKPFWLVVTPTTMETSHHDLFPFPLMNVSHYRGIYNSVFLRSCLLYMSSPMINVDLLAFSNCDLCCQDRVHPQFADVECHNVLVPAQKRVTMVLFPQPSWLVETLIRTCQVFLAPAPDQVMAQKAPSHVGSAGTRGALG